MGHEAIVSMALLGGLLAATCALACAIACAWVARSAHRTRAPMSPPLQHGTVIWQAPAPAPAPPAMEVLPAPPPARPRVQLEGTYPELGLALGGWLQCQPDPDERLRIARDLGTVGGAHGARALLDGVRTGVLTPTVAADNLERAGFEAGIAVAAALRDPEPRVRALAATLVGRCTPLEPARSLAQPRQHHRQPRP